MLIFFAKPQVPRSELDLAEKWFSEPIKIAKLV